MSHNEDLDAERYLSGALTGNEDAIKAVEERMRTDAEFRDEMRIMTAVIPVGREILDRLQKVLDSVQD